MGYRSSQGIELIDSAQTLIRSVNSGSGLSDNFRYRCKEDHQGLDMDRYPGRWYRYHDPADWSVRYLNNLPGLKDTCFRFCCRITLEGCGSVPIGVFMCRHKKQYDYDDHHQGRTL